MTDLFGTIETPSRSKRYIQPRGGADRPGTGPEGETCGSCEHLARTGNNKKYPKCLLTRACWTHSPRTDIRTRWAACSKWERKT